MVDAAAALHALQTDLGEATFLSRRGLRAIEFFVPDRDQDRALEWVSYSWSGTRGAPLLRQVNGGAPQVILPGVQNFIVSYERQSTAVDGNLQAVSSAGGALLSAWTGWPAVPPESFGEHLINSNGRRDGRPATRAARGASRFTSRAAAAERLGRSWPCPAPCR